MSRQVHRQRNLAFSVLTVLMSIVLTLLLSEALLRLFSPDWLSLRMKELTAGAPCEFGTDRHWPAVMVDGNFKRFEPNSNFAVRHLEYDNRAHIDELGGRSTRHKEGAVLVPFLGDSFTFGLGVEDEETYVSLLSELSEGRFLNLGVPGSALHNQSDIIELRHDELGRPPLYVFSFFIGNDFCDIEGHYKRQTPQKGRRPGEEASWLHRINQVVYHNNILKRIYAIQFVRGQVLRFMNRSTSTFTLPIFQICRTDKPYLATAQEFLRKELERLQGIAARLQFDMVFILLPSEYQVHTKHMKIKAQYYGIDEAVLDMHAPNRLLEGELKRLGIGFIDTTDCLGRNERLDDLYYVQDKHFTRYGHQAAAECIEEQGFMDLVRNVSM